MKLDRSRVMESTLFVYLECSMNMGNNVKEELQRRRSAASTACRPLKGAGSQLIEAKLRVEFYDSTLLTVL